MSSSTGREALGLRPAFPVRTERLDLRPHRLEDLDDLLRFHSDADVVRYVPWPVRDRAATEQALRTKLGQDALRAPGEWLVLAVVRRDTGTVIGEVLLKWASATDRQGELGFAFASEHQGQGYAAEAARAMLRLGFDELGLHRISAVCVEDNQRSALLLGRLGFRCEGRLVDHVLFKGSWTTQLVFALREDDWRNPGPRTPAALESDVAGILAVVRTFFAAFTSSDDPAEVDARLDALRAVMLPEAVVVRTCGRTPVAYDVESFVAPRRTLLTDGSLEGFAEHAEHGRVEVFGDVAHWFGRYAKDGRLHGVPSPGAGMKSVQLVRTDTGWRVSAAAWDDDRPGLAARDHLVVEVPGARVRESGRT